MENGNGLLMDFMVSRATGAAERDSLSSMQPSCSLDVDRAEDLTTDPIPTTPQQETLRTECRRAA